MTPFTGKLWLGTLPVGSSFRMDPTKYDSDGYDLGIIESVSPAKESSMDPFEYPDTDARDQEYFDAAGSMKRIRVSGSYVDDNWADVLAWKENLEAFVNGYIFDNAINIYLGIYVKDHYATGIHLWLERLHPPLLELDAAGVPGLNVDPTIVGYPRPAQNSINNRPVCVTLESISFEVRAGESPNATYELMAIVRWEV